MNLNLGFKFLGRHDQGRLIINDTYRFKKALALFQDHPLEVIIRKAYKPRTRNQEGYWRGAIIPMIADHTGQSEEAIEGILEFKFLEVTEEIAPGIIERRIRSTKELNTVEMNNLIERSRKWAWDTFELDIPDPEPKG